MLFLLKIKSHAIWALDVESEKSKVQLRDDNKKNYEKFIRNQLSS